jgi:MarR family transcriptional regulator, temperature-dependent positive regulator of motility
LLPIYTMPGHLIRRLHQLSVSIFAAKMVEVGEDLTPIQYGALSAIGAYPGLDQATVASMIAYDRVTIGGVLDRLEQKHLITRNTKQGDRRSKVLFLTAKGKKLVQKIDDVVVAVQGEIVGGLTLAEQKQFNTLMAKIIVASGDDLSDHYLETKRTGTKD